MKPKKANVYITGNQQSYDKPAGLHVRQRADEDRFRHREDVEIYQCIEWKEDMETYASMLYQEQVKQLIICAYSYGGGYGMRKLCDVIQKRNKKLRKRWQAKGQKFRGHRHPDEISVVAVVLCDAVGRNRYIPTEGLFAKLLYPFQIRSMTDMIYVHVPDVVENVFGLRQREVRPKGHKWKWRGQKIEPPTYVTDLDQTRLDHFNIDESARWNALVDEVQSRFF